VEGILGTEKEGMMKRVLGFLNLSDASGVNGKECRVRFCCYRFGGKVYGKDVCSGCYHTYLSFFKKKKV